MRRISFAFVALAALVPSATAQEKLPVRLFAEAEDFDVRSGNWRVMSYRDNYFAGTSGVAFLSRMACLGAPEQIDEGKKAIAEKVVNIPYADTYDLLARYEQPFQFSCEFTVEVEQGGKVIASFPCGRLNDPKIWGLNGHKRVAMEPYGRGGANNIVWQNPGNVKLAAGPATLRLIAMAQMNGMEERDNAARRHVDVICLTNDKAGIAAQAKTNYLEFDGWLVQDGDLFVRFTNPKDAASPVVPIVAPFEQGQHSPYNVHIRDWTKTTVLKSGRAVSPTKYQIAGPRSTQVKTDALAPIVEAPKGEIPDAEYFKPGEASGWVPLGNAIDSLNYSQWFPQAQYKGKAEGAYLRLEFGIPDGKGGIKVVKDTTVKGPAANLSAACFDIPGCINPNRDLMMTLAKKYWLPEIRTQPEVLQWLNAEVAKFPPVGSVPKRMPIYGIMGYSGALAAFPEAKQLAIALGDNTAVDAVGKKRELVSRWGDPSLDWIKKQEMARKGGFDDLHIVGYGDELNLDAIPLKDGEFAAWLKAKGVSYDGDVKYTTDPKQPLYYYSLIAAKERSIAKYVEGTAYYKSKGVLTGANYSPHANYLVSEIDHIRPFKLKALSMPWTENYAWQKSSEFSPQVVGYLASGLRAGAKYDDLPILMNVMPNSPGQIPDEFRMNFYCSITHGAKMINYVGATPSAVGSMESYVDSYDLKMWKQIHKCTHEAGIFEDYVLDGKVRPAKVGLLLSSVDEIATGATNFSFAMHNNERKAIYFALRHAQVPVDFLSEDDVIEGRAKDYSLIYVTQQSLHSKAVDALQKWCEAGGTLVAHCGGGFFNEFQKENPATARLYGATGTKITTDPNLVSKYLLKENVPFLTKHDLPRYEPIDAANWSIAGLKNGKDDVNPSPNHVFNVPVIVWKQPLTVGDGTVIGKFKDGSPAVVSKKHGTGRAVLFGFLPGQAYLKGALPVRPVDRGANAESFAHYLPTGMSGHLLARLVDDFLPGRMSFEARPVATTDGLVETTCIDTLTKDGKPAKLAIPLVNWSGGPLTSLTVTIRGVENPTKVRSVERGELKFIQGKGSIQLTMPLDVADMILIDR